MRRQRGDGMQHDVPGELPALDTMIVEFSTLALFHSDESETATDGQSVRGNHADRPARACPASHQRPMW